MAFLIEDLDTVVVPKVESVLALLDGLTIEDACHILQFSEVALKRHAETAHFFKPSELFASQISSAIHSACVK